MSLSGLIASKLQNRNTDMSLEEKIKADWKLFRKVANSGKKIDLLKALREDRDRDGK